MNKQASENSDFLEAKRLYEQKMKSFLDRASYQREDLVNQSQDLFAASASYAKYPEGREVILASLEKYRAEPGYQILSSVLESGLEAGSTKNA